MNSESNNITISFTIGLVVNVVSSYLLLSNVINTFIFVLLVASFILIMLMIIIQTRHGELKGEIEKIKERYDELNKNLKIHERLTKLEVIMEQYVKKK